MNCSRCAQPIEPGATFCGNCGQPVQAQPVAATPPPAGPSLAPEPAVPTVPLPPSESVGTSPSTANVPSYAVANPVRQKSETKSMVGLVLAVLGVPGALIPFLGMVLGVGGLVLGTTTRATAKKTVSTMTIIFAVIAVLASIGSYIYSYKRLAEQSSNQGTSSQSADKESGSKTAGSVRPVDTACFKADFPRLKTLDNANGSCALKTYNEASTAAATNIYTVDVLTQKGMTEAQFATAAKDNLSQSLKSNLPGLVISFEKATTFANSPAYVINGKYQGNIGVEMMFVFHQTTHGENVFVIVHGINNGMADTSALGKNWVWK